MRKISEASARAMARILVVDDEPVVHTSLAAVLGAEPYVLQHVDSGTKALEILAREPVDLVLLDVRMPGMSGLQACELIQARASKVPVPVILMSALDDEEIVAQGLGAGASDFVSKPFRLRELRARVAAALRGRSALQTKHQEMLRRQDLVTMVAHDVRGPLSVIRGFAYMLERDMLYAEELTEIIPTIKHELERASRMIDEMLLLGLGDHQELQFSLEECDLVGLVERRVWAHRALVSSFGVQVRFSAEETRFVARVDPVMLERCLDNLIANALKHSPNPAVVEVRLAAVGDEVEISVRDQGPGVPAEFQESIFNLFDTGATKAKGPAGFGVGLAFCKLVVQRFAGRISVANAPDRGAIFRIHLPLIPTAQPARLADPHEILARP